MTFSAPRRGNARNNGRLSQAQVSAPAAPSPPTPAVARGQGRPPAALTPALFARVPPAWPAAQCHTSPHPHRPPPPA